MSDVFQEVDEDLRRQELEAVWRRFGPWAVGAAVVAIAITSGYMYWQNQKEAALAEAGDQLLGGIELILDGDNAGASASFAALAEDAPGGYRPMALFQQAAALRLEGRLADAILIYDQLADDASLNVDFQNLARLSAGYIALESPVMGFPDIESRLGSVTETAGPWRYHALEVLGFAAYSAGQSETATEHYRQITDDGMAPTSVASRANEMLEMIESAASASAD